jgi:dTDP-4-amino-4,6-dideoxygalactose transaminase
MSIPVMKPILPRAEKVMSYLSEMDDVQIYTNHGPLLTQLENRYARFFNINPEKVVCSANATLAILGACQVVPGLNLELPSYTFPATIHAGRMSGKKIVLRDIELETYKLVSGDSEEKKDADSMNQVYVLPYGAKIAIPSLKANSYQIIDAAASIGNYEGGLSNIEQTQVFCFSLHATKVLGAGEGAVSVFGSEEIASKFRSWINFGFSGSREAREIGINAKMSEISAAYAHAALDDYFLEKQDWLRVGISQKKISETLGVNPSFVTEDSVTPYWIVEFEDPDSCSRAALALNTNRIETRKWWGNGCHKMKAFADLASGNFSNTDDIASRVLGLPKYRDLANQSIELIGEIIAENSF